MKIAFACDHAGYDVKELIINQLRQLGHEVIDFGCSGTASCDYPDHGFAAARAVSRGEAERGVLVCGTGIGMSIIANKVKGVRAALVTNNEVAGLTRQHNDSNVICLAARFTKPEDISQWLGTWLATPFSGEPRHIKRIEKIKDMECGPLKS